MLSLIMTAVGLAGLILVGLFMLFSTDPTAEVAGFIGAVAVWFFAMSLLGSMTSL